MASSAVCEYPFIVENGVNGFLFNPENVPEMACAMEALVRLTPSQRDEMAVANRMKIEENNSPKSFKKKYIELLIVNCSR